MLREWLEACEGANGFQVEWINWPQESPHLFRTTVRVGDKDGKALVEWVNKAGNNCDTTVDTPEELRALLREIAKSV